MGYISETTHLILNPSTSKALWCFDRDVEQANGCMQQACESFFQRIGFKVIVRRRWQSVEGGILFVSDHESALDGFAMSLACPIDKCLRRVIFKFTGHFLGSNVARQCILVWPRGNYSNLMRQANSFVDSVAYLITHRWGPWVGRHRALDKICNALDAGDGVTLLPSGTVGKDGWRSGIGGIVQTSMSRSPSKAKNKWLAPVYLEWDQTSRVVTVDAPGLISFSSILDQANANLNRTELTSWIRERYRDRSLTLFNST